MGLVVVEMMVKMLQGLYLEMIMMLVNMPWGQKQFVGFEVMQSSVVLAVDRLSEQIEDRWPFGDPKRSVWQCHIVIIWLVRGYMGLLITMFDVALILIWRVVVPWQDLLG